MKNLAFVGWFVLWSLAACRTEPEPIAVGEDYCGQCRMAIADPRFGGEVITAKGRVLKFDSISCLTGYLAETLEKPAQVLVSDFLHSGSLIPVEQAHFLRSEKIKGPMGPGLVASADETGLRKFQTSVKGEWLQWEKISASSH